jgi:restriction endonuclease S subunit
MKVVQLGEVASFQGGSQPAKSNFIYQEKKGFVRFIQIRDFKSEKNLTYIPESKKNRLCKESDILIGRYGASVGQILTGLSGAYNVALIKASPNESLMVRKFFYYFLNSKFFQSPLLDVSKRSAQSGFTKEEISSFLIPLPSIGEQELTVEKLDNAFAEVDSLEKNLYLKEEKINELLKSMLSAAFSNVEKFDMTVEKLQDVCLISKGKTITKATSVDGNVPVIGGGLGPTYYHNIANQNAPVITISASGANAGFVNFWDEPIWASDCSTIIEKPGSPALIGYIYKFLQSSQEFINSKLRKGSAQPHVYSSDIGQLRIPLPSIIEQKQILEKLDIAFAEIDNLKNQISIEKERISSLRQSILSNAFSFEEKAA